MITTRRQFLVGGVRVAAALPFAAALGRAFAAPAGDEGERVLVVVQLTGGNDGLNTLVPWRQDGYWRARPTLGLARAQLVRLDDDHGLHPSLRPLEPLLGAGRAALVHGVGLPEPNRSHFRSMEIWHTAEPDAPPGDTGWLGRLADQLALRRPGTMPALHVGDAELPRALFGRESFAPTVRDARGFRLARTSSAAAFERARAELLDAPAEAGDVAFLRDAARATYSAAERMERLATDPSATSYPAHPLAQELRLVARLVGGGFGTRVFHVALGGFDTHAAQAPAHAALLADVASALAAFQRDLDASGAGERVLTLVFSEFGRRVHENGSRGTDHGAAAPVLLLGGTVRGGAHGTPPDLERLVDGDVPTTTDFRSLYTTLERDWMGLAPSTNAPALDLLRS